MLKLPGAKERPTDYISNAAALPTGPYPLPLTESDGAVVGH